MPSSFASRAYFAESARTTRPNSSALPPTGSVAVCSRLSRVATSAMALAISAFRYPMTAIGVPAGTKAPYQDSSTRSVKPASSSVGTSGKLWARARSGRLREESQRSGLVVRQQRGRPQETDQDVAGDEIVNSLAGAPIGHVLQFDARR